MEKNGQDKITAFDTLFTTNHIQMLKILMPYLEPPMGRQMAVYIKYLELRYALSYFDSPSHELYGCAGSHGSPFSGAGALPKEEFNVSKLCSELLPYCTNDEKQKVEQISGLFRSMEMYKEMSQTLELMKDFMPDFSPEAMSDLMQNFQPNPMSGQKAGQAQDTVSAAAGQDSPRNHGGGADGSEPAAMPGSRKQENGMAEMLTNMLSPEQKAMLEMFGGNLAYESK